MGSLLVAAERPVVDLEIGSHEECESWARSVESVRDSWIPRNGTGFYTLGVASYIDVHFSDRSEEDYYRRLPATNVVILEKLGDLLERVRERLEHLLGRPARFETSVAVPGVHIFEYEAIAVHPNAGVHFDLQYQGIRFPHPVDPSHLISFTLALRLPHDGGGLDTWDFLPSDLQRFERLGRHIDLDQLSRTKPRIRHEYAIGRMAVQLKPILHRIGPVANKHPGDQRMTLQGHGILDEYGWVLYW